MPPGGQRALLWLSVVAILVSTILGAGKLGLLSVSVTYFGRRVVSVPTWWTLEGPSAVSEAPTGRCTVPSLQGPYQDSVVRCC